MAKIKLLFDRSTGLKVTETAPGEYTITQETVVGAGGDVLVSAEPFTLMAGKPKPHTHLVSDVIGAGTGSSSLVFSKGTEAAKPALAEGEMYWATDTDTLFIGT